MVHPLRNLRQQKKNAVLQIGTKILGAIVGEMVPVHTGGRGSGGGGGTKETLPLIMQ